MNVEHLESQFPKVVTEGGSFSMSIFRKLLRKFGKAEETKQFEYVEEDTKCDKCEFLNKCMGNGYLIEITRLGDARSHFARDFGCDCNAAERVIK